MSEPACTHRYRFIHYIDPFTEMRVPFAALIHEIAAGAKTSRVIPVAHPDLGPAAEGLIRLLLGADLAGPQYFDWLPRSVGPQVAITARACAVPPGVEDVDAWISAIVSGARR